MTNIHSYFSCFRSPEQASDGVSQPGSSSSPPEEGSSVPIESVSSRQSAPQRSSRQMALLAQVPAQSKSKEAYFAEWEAWARQRNNGPVNDCETAVARMKKWLDDLEKAIRDNLAK